MAPEALSGELVGEQADVYSLATIAYYLLTGELPFPGKSPRELFQQLLTQSPRPAQPGRQGRSSSAPASRPRSWPGLRARPRQALQTIEANSARRFCAAARAEPEKKKGFLSGLFGKD